MNSLERLHAMPTQGVALPFQGFIRYRESIEGRPHLISEHGQMKGDLPPFVLLHGIGSGSGSWLEQLTDTRLSHILAWDAPGYADSTPLDVAQPQAADYAQVMWAWLDALQISDVHLVGHSLGCIMAASAARLQSSRVKSLTLLAPAQGYGTASISVQHKKRDDRLQAMHELGLQKMAEQRAPRLLSKQATPEQIALATYMMSHLNEGGYEQATSMLSMADIRADLRAFKSASAAPIQIACGFSDVITPPAACHDLAQSIASPYTDLPGAGHLCAMQAPQQIFHLLQALQLRQHESRTHA